MFRNKFNAWALFDKDSDGGGGGGGNSDAAQRMLDRYHGDAIRAIEKLQGENFELRDQRREMQSEIATLKAKTPEGAIVLSAEDAKAWAAYQALGKPDEVRTKIDAGAKLQSEVDKFQRADLLGKVADAAGYKPNALINLDMLEKAKGKTLTFELRDVTVNGKTEKAAFVKDGDKESPIGEYATANWADMLPALVAKPGQGSGQGAGGVKFPAQHTGSNAQGGSVADAFMAEREKSRQAETNPLLKK